MIGFPFKSASRSIELALLISKEGKAEGCGGEFPVDMASIIQLPFSSEAEEEEEEEEGVEKISLAAWLFVKYL